jgi:hypothetical protein
VLTITGSSSPCIAQIVFDVAVVQVNSRDANAAETLQKGDTIHPGQARGSA